MKSKAIVEGFRQSVADRGLRFRYLVADGDSSTYQNVCMEDPYLDVGMRVTKIECKNHVLRRLCTNLRKFAEGLSGRQVPDPKRENEHIKPKSFVSSKIFSLRMGIERACSYRGQQLSEGRKAIALLRSDILNAPRHVFGDHAKCSSYFCNGLPKNDKEFNAVPTLVALKIFSGIEEIVLRVADKAESLIHNLNNNIVESFNTTAMQSTGKKIVNYTGRFGYKGRSYRSVVRFNDMDSFEKLHMHLTGFSAGSAYRKFKGMQIRKKLRNRMSSTRKSKYSIVKCNRAKPDKDYGESSQTSDMNPATYKIAADRVLKSLKVCVKKIVKKKSQINLAHLKHSVCRRYHLRKPD